jgi:hypothetical protein
MLEWEQRMPEVGEQISREQEPVSSYLLSEPRILREACRATRGDLGGRRCPVCCVADFCTAQARRAGWPVGSC